MLNQILSKNAKSYLNCDLPPLKSTQKFINIQESNALENRAYTSLCELSATICHDEET